MAALDGLLVLDLTRLLPGAYATQLLADHGADVVKVEEPGRGDYLRDMPPRVGPVGAMFQAVNRGKQSVAIDLRSNEGGEIFAALVREADVLMEGFRPGVLERLNLAPESLLDVNPQLVVCRLSGYGQEGPWRERAGHDLNYLAACGVTSLVRDREGAPVPVGLPIGDLIGGMSAATGVLLALTERARTSRGRVVDAAISDALLSFLAPVAGLIAALPGAELDTLTAPVGAPYYDIYEAAEGSHLSVACLEPQFWTRFCDAIKLPHLRDRQHGSPEEQAQVHSEIGGVLITATAREWEERLRDVDVCVAAVRTPTEALFDDHHRSRGAMVSHADGADGWVESPGPPVRLMGDQPRLSGPAPRLGEHTRAWLERIGFGKRLEELAAAGVIELDASSAREVPT